MGSINDLVTFQMLKPLQGQTTANIQPVSMSGSPAQMQPAGQTTNINIQKPPPQAPDTTSAGQAAYNAADQANAMGASQAPDTMGALPPPETAQQSMTDVSDATLKQNVHSDTDKIDNLLSNIGSYSYKYKDKQDGDKTYVSPMAQEFEKTEIGKSAVIETPRGKMVDYSRLVGASLSALSIHHDELKQQNKTISRLEKDMATLKAALTKAKRK